jgi:hypothetical protein
MLEGLRARAGRFAEARVQVRSAMLAERLQAELPRGLRAEASAEGVRISGRGAARRLALDPALRWIAARLA